MTAPSAKSLSPRARFARLARALLATAGRAAVARALPLYAALGIAAAVVFGPNGMRAHDVTVIASRALAGRAVLLAIWTLLAAPAARALLRAPRTGYLRALPVPLAWFHVVLGAVLLALQVPLGALFAVGDSLVEGAAAACVCAGAHALLFARPRGLPEAAAAIALALGIALGSPPGMIAVGCLALAVGVPRAFARALEGGARAAPRIARRGALAAIARAHAKTLARAEAAAVARGAWFALAGGALLALLEHNRRPAGADAVVALGVAIAAVPLGAAAAGVAGPLVVSERRLAWLFATAGTSRAVTALATAACAAALGAACGLVVGAVGAAGVAGAGVPRLLLAGSCTAWGALLALQALAIARWSEGPRGVDGARLVLTLLAAIAAAWLGTAAMGARVLAPAAACTAVLSWGSIVRADRRTRAS